ncbi:MAG: hypothetical protein WDW38_010947 [Sanguina aurantia]
MQPSGSRARRRQRMAQIVQRRTERAGISQCLAACAKGPTDAGWRLTRFQEMQGRQATGVERVEPVGRLHPVDTPRQPAACPKRGHDRHGAIHGRVEFVGLASARGRIQRIGQHAQRVRNAPAQHISRAHRPDKPRRGDTDHGTDDQGSRKDVNLED